MRDNVTDIPKTDKKEIVYKCRKCGKTMFEAHLEKGSTIVKKCDNCKTWNTIAAK